MKIQKWVHFIPKQFVLAGHDINCVTLHCNNDEADQIMKFAEGGDLSGKVWVVDCSSEAVGTLKNVGYLYSLAFELADDYNKFLKRFG